MSRPYVIIGGFMSLDGKTAPKTREGQLFTPFMGPKMHEKLHRLRTEVDCILVGVGTILADNPRLTVRLAEGKTPLRVVLDSKARTPPDAAILNPEEAPTIIAVSRSAPSDIVEKLRSRVEVIECGEVKVNVKELLERLYERGVRRLLVEGGGEVRWSFLRERVVDELFVWVMPMVWGGRDAPTFIDGEGFTTGDDAVELELKKMSVEEGIIVVSFKVKRS